MRVEIYGDANRETVSGPTVQFTADDAAPVTDLKAQITPSIAGHSSVTITANGQNTSVSLTKPVYGGAVDVTTGVVTETHGGGAYNPTEVPTDLSSKIVSATTERSASGSVASFNCTLGEYPMSALTAAINPVQDLHGYDRPWPGGGGKNLLPFASSGTQTANGVTCEVSGGVVTLSGTASAATGFSYDLAAGVDLGPSANRLSFFNTIAKSGTNNVTVEFYRGTTRVHYWAMSPVNRSVVSWTDSGNEVVDRIRIAITSGTNVDGMQISPMLTAIAADYSTFSPYENICPITGWTGLSVYRTGVNVWDEQWELGGINGSGANHNASDRIRSKNYIPVTPGATYYYYINSTYGIFTWGYDSSKTYVGRVPANGWAIGNNTVTIPNGVYYIRIVVQPGYGTTYNNDISINYPATDRDYHPYAGDTYSVTFPSEAGTVYGGTLDVVNGVLTVTSSMVDAGELTWSRTSWGGWRSSPLAEMATIDPSVVSTLVAERYKTVANTSIRKEPGLISTGSSSNAKAIFVNDTATPTGQIVYPLDTPVTYTLTPQDIDTLTGQNNVWADTGDVTVSYRDGLLSNVSGIMTNSTALTAGENITYTLSQERTFQIPGTVIRTVVGNNVMSASTGNISVTWSSHWFDITPWIAYQGLTFSRNDVDAPNAGRDMSGYMHRGRVGVKEKMNVTTVQLTRAQSSTLQTLLYPETIQVRVTPYPRTNTSHTMSMYTNNVKTTYVIHRENGEDLQSLTFPLIEN